jgi:hypothetical protein
LPGLIKPFRAQIITKRTVELPRTHNGSAGSCSPIDIDADVVPGDRVMVGTRLRDIDAEIISGDHVSFGGIV